MQFEFVVRGLEALGYLEHTDYEVLQHAQVARCSARERRCILFDKMWRVSIGALALIGQVQFLSIFDHMQIQLSDSVQCAMCALLRMRFCVHCAG